MKTLTILTLALMLTVPAQAFLNETNIDDSTNLYSSSSSHANANASSFANSDQSQGQLQGQAQQNVSSNDNSNGVSIDGDEVNSYSYSHSINGTRGQDTMSVGCFLGGIGFSQDNQVTKIVNRVVVLQQLGVLTDEDIVEAKKDIKESTERQRFLGFLWHTDGTFELCTLFGLLDW